MTSAPNIRFHDVDRFSEQLGEFLDTADPEAVVQAVVRAAQYVEDLAERVVPDAMTQVNNATETMTRGARTLADRLREPAGSPVT